MTESSCHQFGGSAVALNSVSSLSSSSLAPEDNLEHPLLLLTQQPDSHHFNERRIVLNDTVKVGRSVARARPCEANAIFDCKVLSRNHAIFWYDNGKVWLKDTKSSNGTFVNSQLLSKGTEDSAPREIYSGDIIQFGVEVVENTTTHGCIIAQTTIFLSDGNELRRHADMGGPPSGNIPISNYYEEQIYQLAQYIQEASHREQTLEKKLNSLSQLIIDTQEASDSSWKVILNQDRLMEKLELLQEQVDMHAKGDDRDTLTSELHRVLEQRYGLERESKNLLEGLIVEKSDVLQRVVDLEQSLGASEVECSQLRATLESLQSEHGQISEKLSSGKDEVEHLQKKFQDAQIDYNNELTRLNLEKELITTRYEQLCMEADELRIKLQEVSNKLAKGSQNFHTLLDGGNQYMDNLRDMMQKSDDRQSDLDSSIVGIQNQLSKALVSEIIALQNLNHLEESMVHNDENIDSFIMGTTSDLGLHFIESHKYIRNGMEVIALMKEELLRLHDVIQNEKRLENEGCNVEGSFQEMESLLEKMKESQVKTKTLLAKIPERLLMSALTEDNIDAVNESLKEVNETVSICDNEVQTELVTLVHSEVQYCCSETETSGTQVDFLSSALSEKVDCLHQSIESLEQEKKLTESLKMDLIHLQDENRQLTKKSYDLSVTVQELKSKESSLREEIDVRRDTIQRISNEGYSQLYHESQDLRKRVLEIEEEMSNKRREYDVLFEQYELLISTQSTVTPDIESVARIRELEELCSLQQSEIDEMRNAVSSSYQSILSRSRKNNKHSAQTSAFLSSIHVARDGNPLSEPQKGVLTAPLLFRNLSWSKTKLSD